MNTKKDRVIIIGADGATFNLILPWVKEGILPNFGSLMREGVWGRLDPAPNMRSAASWASFYTGKNPGKHGLYEFYDFVPETYGIQFINGSHCMEPSLWKILSDQGKRSVCVNVPMTYPAEAINGIILTGLDAPGKASKGFVHPPEILEELEREVGPYVIEPGVTGYIIAGKLEEAVKKLYEEIEQKRQVMRYLFDEENWDFFTLVYRSVDAAQHCFWKYMDATHPQHDPALKAKCGNVIKNVYIKLDQALGEVRDRMRENDRLVVLSDHGFGQKHPANNQLNAWLASKGYLTYGGRGAGRFSSIGTRLVLKNIYHYLAGILPRRHKEVFARLLPGVRNKVHSQLCFTGIDWSRTMAYSDTLFANIRINLNGREGEGIVKPGTDYDHLVREIRGQLLECRDATHGEPIVEAVMLRDEIYRGLGTEKAPDLTIRWREDVPITGIEVAEAFDSQALPAARPWIPAEDPSVISGDHHRYGIFLACGPGIRRGVEVADAHIMDVAPTALYWLNVPVPEDMDGKVLASILTDEELTRRPVALQEKAQSASTRREGFVDYDADEEKAIADRLRALGYLE